MFQTQDRVYVIWTWRN